MVLRGGRIQIERPKLQLAPICLDHSRCALLHPPHLLHNQRVLRPHITIPCTLGDSFTNSTSPGCGLLVVTSADRLHASWQPAARSRTRGNNTPHVEQLLTSLARNATLVTVLDGHPAALSWLGAVAGHRVVPLGVERFGQSGTVSDLYREHSLDAEAIIDAVACSWHPGPR